MKKIALLMCCFIIYRLNAQIGLGITIPHPNAYFEISSTTKGVLLPRMKSAERMALTPAPTATAKGLLVYDTDLSSYMYWDGVNWQTISSTSNGIWATNGNNIHNTNTGNVGIANNNPVSPLSFDGNLGDKISLWGSDPLQNYGFGVQSGLLQIHAATPLVDDIAFGTGATNNFYEAVRIKGNGNVGIGNTDALFKLDVSGRVRIRSGGNIFTTPGLWLNDISNSATPAFIGMESDNSVGFYGAGHGWGFTMNTNTGKVRIADGTQAAGRILSSDANGVTSWVNSTAITSAVNGGFGVGGVNLTTAMGDAYTLAFIDLPVGKFIVFGTVLITQGGSGGPLLANQSMWIRTFFSSSNVTNIPLPFGEVIGASLMSGSLAAPSEYGLVNGQVIINNTSGATKRYYLWASMANYGGQPGGFALSGFGCAGCAENQLVAIPMN